MSGWKRGAAARGRALDPMTELMLDLAGVTVGSQVLDLGVLATDISASVTPLIRAEDLAGPQR